MNQNQALQALLSSFPRQDASDPELAAVAYVFAIEDADGQAVVAAVKRFIRGEVAGHDPRFCPTPAQLAQEARRIEKLMAWEAKKSTLALAPPKPEPVFTEAERRANLARLKALSDRLEGRESTGEAAIYRPDIDARMGGHSNTIEATA